VSPPGRARAGPGLPRARTRQGGPRGLTALLGGALAALLATSPAPAQGPRPNDPLYLARGSWGQPFDDQWALRRIGFTPVGRGRSAWEAGPGPRHPVVVAVVDTGLDHRHPDLRPETLWRNPREIPNGRDDDGNGYVDDLIGWNFVDGTNDLSDHSGHGTHVAGIIGAATDNGVGIAGVNPDVRLMPLKAMTLAGQGRSAAVAEAIAYAVRHGARVVNLSLGGERLTGLHRRALEHARARGVVVVAAAGNLGIDAAGFGQAGLPHVITVAATDPEDRSPAFSNHGATVKLAAPGVAVLSLRARGTDFTLGIEGYAPGSHVVGPGGDYYRANGTSFAAPFVTGVASLLLARAPALTSAQVERMLVMSADDVGPPGWDRDTGTGRLNARRALEADPEWFLQARLVAVEPAEEGGQVVLRVLGAAVGTHLRGYTIELGQGEAPRRWREVVRGSRAVEDGLLGAIPARAIPSAGTWTVRVVAHDRRGQARESRTTLAIE
jgi:hypothetical protein